MSPARTPYEDSRIPLRILPNVPKSVAIVGVGGSGSWLAMLFAQMRGVTKIALFDGDTVEATNLERTPYRICDIGKQKSVAMKEMIAERNLSVRVTAYGHLDEANQTLLNMYDLKIVAADKISVRQMVLAKSNAISVGYDVSENYDWVSVSEVQMWQVHEGEQQDGYTFDPSWSGPAMLSAIMVAYGVLNNRRPIATSLKIDDMYKNILPHDRELLDMYNEFDISKIPFHRIGTMDYPDESIYKPNRQIKVVDCEDEGKKLPESIMTYADMQVRDADGNRYKIENCACGALMVWSDVGDIICAKKYEFDCPSCAKPMKYLEDIKTLLCTKCGIKRCKYPTRKITTMAVYGRDGRLFCCREPTVVKITPEPVAVCKTCDSHYDTCECGETLTLRGDVLLCSKCNICPLCGKFYEDALEHCVECYNNSGGMDCRSCRNYLSEYEGHVFCHDCNEAWSCDMCGFIYPEHVWPCPSCVCSHCESNFDYNSEHDVTYCPNCDGEPGICRLCGEELIEITGDNPWDGICVCNETEPEVDEPEFEVEWR